MIVTCPGCNAKFRVKDETIPPGGAKMKCPKCDTMFAARRSDDATRSSPGPDPGASPAPQPVAFDALPGAAPAVPAQQAAREWDAKMSGEVARPPRDPFYEANPQVAQAPPAASTDFISSSLASGPIRPGAPSALGTPASELSDPFANIDLVAPSSQPLAGSAAAGGRAAVAPAMVPAAAMASAGEPASGSSGVVVRDRNGKYTTFKYLPPARQFVAEHPDPDALEVSIAGAPYTAVKLSYAFSDIDFTRAAPVVQASEPPAAAKKTADVYPPPPPIEALAGVPRGPTLLARVGLVAAATGAVLALLFALWQSELLPLEPYATQAVSRATGLHSPLVLPDLDPTQEAQRSLREAQALRDKGALGLAVLSYKRAQLFRPGDDAIETALADCYEQLGDNDRAAEMLRGAGKRAAANSAPAAGTKVTPATRPAPGGKTDPRGREVKPGTPAKAPAKPGEPRKAPQLIGPKAPGNR